MDGEQFRTFISWFSNYIKGFHSDDPLKQSAVDFKAGHTGRVRAKIIGIGRSLNLSAGELLLAETIALFHDVGRFRQFDVYRTFNDRLSENHALLGLQELQRAGVLSTLSETEHHLVVTAIACHNMRDLPPDLSDRQLLFARLIRDADKLDTLEQFTNECTRKDSAPDPLLASILPDTPGYSPALVDDLLRSRPCRYADVHNLNDRKLALLSWLYDLNFAYSIQEVARNDCIGRIVGALPDAKEIREVQQHLQHYAADRLALLGR